jgi:hypothetical protein
MHKARIGLVAAGIALAASALLAQEAGYLDLTDPAPRARIRSPNGGTGCGFSDGTIGELTLTVASTDKRAYSIGEDVTFEIKIENTGGSSIELPWTPSLANVEPSDPTLSYTYLNAEVDLILSETDSHPSHYLFSRFYGSTDLPWTVRELKPKQSVLIRARGKLQTDQESWIKEAEKAQPLPLKASAGFKLITITYTAAGKRNSASESASCVPLAIRAANQIDLALWPGETK